MRPWHYLVAALLILCLAVSPVAAAPKIWLDQYDNRFEMKISADAVDEDLTDFPVMLTLSRSAGTNDAYTALVFDELRNDANRKKIMVTDAMGNPLYVEIKEWDTAARTAYLWVKVPHVSSHYNTVLHFYYDRDVSDNTQYVGDTGEVAAQQVWSNGYAGVWQMMPSVSALPGHSYYQTINYAATDQATYQQDLVIHRSAGTAYEETVGELKIWHVYVGNRCKSDYGDVRFTDASGTALDYYLWPDYDSSSARFTVRLEGATSAGDLLVWYGNPSATTTSDGKQTYSFFDQFDDPSLDTDMWDIDPYANVYTSNGRLYVKGNYTIYSGEFAGVQAKPRFDTATHILEMEMIYEGGAYGHFGWADGNLLAHNRMVFRKTAPTENRQVHTMKASTYTSIVQNWAAPPNTYSIHRSGITAYFYVGGTLVNSYLSSSQVPTIELGPHFTNNGNVDHMVIESVLVRAYSATPPAATAFGPEQVIKQIRDSTSNQNHGTIYGATATQGPTGTALAFDGVNNYVDCGNSVTLDPGANDFTLEVMAKAISSTSRSPLVSKGGWYDDGYSIQMNTAGEHYYFVARPSGSSGNVHANLWLSRAWDWKYIGGSRSGNTISAVVDGIAKSNTVLPPDASLTSSKPLLIGKYTGGANFFNGEVGFVALSIPARSPAWIAAQNAVLTDTFVAYDLDLSKRASTTFSYDINKATYLGWLKETNETGVYLGIITSVTKSMDDVMGGMTFVLIYVGALAIIAAKTESFEVPLVISILIMPSFSIFGYFGLSLPMDVLANYIILIGIGSAAVIFGAFMVFMRR